MRDKGGLVEQRGVCFGEDEKRARSGGADPGADVSGGVCVS